MIYAKTNVFINYFGLTDKRVINSAFRAEGKPQKLNDIELRLDR